MSEPNEPTPVTSSPILETAIATPRSSLLYSPSVAVTSDPHDLSDFYYFQDATEHESYGCFGSQSWSKIALQMSFYDPAVRYAIFALGSLLNDSVKSQQGDVDFPKRTLHHYTRSISILSHGISSTGFSPRVALVLCLAFVWIELLRNDIGRAVAHCRGGLAILANRANSPGEETVESCLVRAFTRLHAQVQLHGNPAARLEQVPEAGVGNHFYEAILPLSFENTDQSRLHLEHISLSTFHTMRRLKRLNGGSTRIPGAQMSLELFTTTCIIEGQKQALTQWHQVFLALRTQRRSPMPQELAAMSILEVQYIAQKLMLACLDDPFEMGFDSDEFRDGFERIVILSEELSHDKHFQSRFQLSLDTGLLPPLFFVALKCRVPELRSKAIDLMRTCPHREGLWDRGRLVQVATWKAQKEGLYAGVPAPAARIWCETADVVTNDQGQDRIVVKYKQGIQAREVRETRNEAMGKHLASMSDMI